MPSWSVLCSVVDLSSWKLVSCHVLAGHARLPAKRSNRIVKRPSFLNSTGTPACRAASIPRHMSSEMPRSVVGHASIGDLEPGMTCIHAEAALVGNRVVQNSGVGKKQIRRAIGDPLRCSASPIARRA